MGDVSRVVRQLRRSALWKSFASRHFHYESHRDTANVDYEFWGEGAGGRVYLQNAS